jgi:hypothetical protein
LPASFYVPRHDGSLVGTVTAYRFETSVDGVDWSPDVDSGHFGNMRNNPELQKVTFDPIYARFFRFTILHALGASDFASAAEISVISAASGAVH